MGHLWIVRYLRRIGGIHRSVAKAPVCLPRGGLVEDSMSRTAEDDWERVGARAEMRAPRLPSDDICENKHQGNAESVQANRRVASSKVKSQQAILEILREYGALTCKEIAIARDVPMHSVSGRITELKEQGLVRPTDLIRDGGRVVEIV